jgi:hypothetical protein
VLEFSLQVCVACLFTQSLCFVVEDFRRIRFLEKKEAEQLNNGVGDTNGPEHPTPRYIFRNESSSEWAFMLKLVLVIGRRS